MQPWIWHITRLRIIHSRMKVDVISRLIKLSKNSLFCTTVWGTIASCLLLIIVPNETSKFWSINWCVHHLHWWLNESHWWTYWLITLPINVYILETIFEKNIGSKAYLVCYLNYISVRKFYLLLKSTTGDLQNSSDRSVQ